MLRCYKSQICKKQLVMKSVDEEPAAKYQGLKTQPLLLPLHLRRRGRQDLGGSVHHYSVTVKV